MIASVKCTYISGYKVVLSIGLALSTILWVHFIISTFLHLISLQYWSCSWNVQIISRLIMKWVLTCNCGESNFRTIIFVANKVRRLVCEIFVYKVECSEISLEWCDNKAISIGIYLYEPYRRLFYTFVCPIFGLTTEEASSHLSAHNSYENIIELLWIPL